MQRTFLCASLIGMVLLVGIPSSFATYYYEDDRQRIAQQMLENAVKAFVLDKNSTFAAIQNADDATYHDREIYVVVMDMDGVIISHGVTPGLVGTDTHNQVDANGVNLGDLFDANRSPYGKWVSYMWSNPENPTGGPEQKTTWLKAAGEYTFAVGVYPGYAPFETSLTNTDRQNQRLAVEMVEQAIGAFALDRDAAMAAIEDADNPLYHDGQLYVFVLDEDYVIVAHGADPGLVGTDTHDLVDTNGVNIGDLFEANNSPYGSWVEYYWPNPDTESDQSELKLSWNKAWGGYTFVVGVYPGEEGALNDITLSDYDEVRQQAAGEMLQNAMNAFRLDPATTLAEIQNTSNALYHAGELHMSVLDKDGTILSHGADPELVGADIHDIVDKNGVNLGDIFDENHSPYGKWVAYDWQNPATESSESEQKMALLANYHGYTFGVGIYPGYAGPLEALSDEDRQRQRLAVDMVEQALAAIDADKDSAFAAIMDRDNPLYHDGQLYVFVLDEDYVIVSHGVDPGLVGTDTHDLVDTKGVNIGDLFEANISPYGSWVDYYWPNPDTESDQSELKITWLKERGGLVAAVGFYP